MNILNKKKVILGVALLAILVSIPLTLSQLSKPQQQESHAAGGSTTLSFSPDSSTTNPIQVNVGDAVDLDVTVDPGTNQVSFVKYQVTFDPTKIKVVDTSPAVINTAVKNLVNVEGPVITKNSISQSVSIGADPTKVLTNKTKIVTLHFTAIGKTNGKPTSLKFGKISQALSAGPSDQASQNVLSSTTPAFIAIGDGSPSTSPSPAGTALQFTLLLHGVGSAGDNPNPDSSLSNKNPLHPSRNLNVQVLDSNNQVVASVSAPVSYASGSGTFMGSVGLPASVASGNYSVKIQTDRYLWKLVPGIQQITSGQTTQVPTTQMVTGDTNNDNVLNVLDYNALLDCGYGQINPLPMNDPNSVFNSSACQVHTPAVDVDLNDDGIINSTDYNLFLREISVQSGD